MKTARRLTQTQLRDLADELRSERARLERSIATRMEADAVASTTDSFRGGTQAEGGLAVALETRMFDRRQILDSAMQRLETGTYGVCVGCRNPIPYGRLLVMPAAAYCVGCGAAA
jgi:RNA polymerase-binding transcription factor